MNREDFRYIVRHRFLPYSLLNHTDKPTQWFGSRYETAAKAIEEAKKSANYSPRDGIQVQVIKEVIVWEFKNDGFVGTWGNPETAPGGIEIVPGEIEIIESPEPEEPPTVEELVWRLFTEKKKTRKEITVIVAMSYNTVCKIIRAERRRRGSLGLNADAR